MGDNDLKARLESLEESVDNLRKEGENTTKLCKRILHALEGSPLEGQQGLVHKIEATAKVVETEIPQIKKDVEKLNMERKVALALLASGGGIGAVVARLFAS